MEKTYPYFNRELSWLAFNQRVLFQAQGNTHPLLERLKFISIFSTNLDEFFMVRVAGLEKQLEAKPNARSRDGLTPYEQLEKIKIIVRRQLRLRHRIFYNDILPKLEEQGVFLKKCSELSQVELNACEKFFDENIFPTLIPLAFDPGRPFPFISNLSLSLAIQLKEEGNKKPSFARIKVPSNIPRLIYLESIMKNTKLKTKTFLFSEDIIIKFIKKLFPQIAIDFVHLFRITRDTDLEIEEDEAHDLLQTISEGLQQMRYGKVVKLDISRGVPTYIRKILMTNLEITDRQLYAISGILGPGSLFELYHLLNDTELKDKPFSPRWRFPSSLKENSVSLFDEVKTQDKLILHPYDSFDPVVELLREAARDPNVITIKQTLYRVGAKSPIVQTLLDAARQGKQVAAILELKARFDEENNILWAKKLESEGIHVVYGLVGLKVHAKMLLIVRKEKDKIVRYVHLGTGNYNPFTAKIYTDYSFFSSDPRISKDVVDIFNYLTGYSKQVSFERLLISPMSMRKKIIEKIEREAKRGKNGHIIIKVNSLVDNKIIEALYEASKQQVKIDLIVRGVCSLVPGIKNVSENIRVISVIGRFLEHSRVLYFYNGGESEFYLGSADMMERNLDRRVEVLFPILDKTCQIVILEHLNIMLEDNNISWELLSDGTYKLLRNKRKSPKNAINCHEKILLLK